MLDSQKFIGESNIHLKKLFRWINLYVLDKDTYLSMILTYLRIIDK
jgi:hypothetical protein